MVTVKLTYREIRTLELAFSMSCEPPYSKGEDVAHLEEIKGKLSRAALRANPSN